VARVPAASTAIAQVQRGVADDICLSSATKTPNGRGIYPLANEVAIWRARYESMSEWSRSGAAYGASDSFRSCHHIPRWKVGRTIIEIIRGAELGNRPRTA
jgi:hypothetical protein